MMAWQRKRHPEDVPTPVAVAVSDYCRRAKAPASPAVVRDALSMLEAQRDPEVKAMADSEPPAKLGPFAMVDVLLGTSLAIATERQVSGYYDELRRTVAAQPLPSTAVEVLTSAKRSGPGAQPQSVPSKPAKPKAMSLKERVAPRRRTAGQPFPAGAKSAPGVAASSFLPKRSLPAPRGRFTTLDPSRASFESLFRPDAKDTLITLIEQVPHRVAIKRTLEQGYTGRRGAALELGDVEDLLEAQQLFEPIEKKEKEGVLAVLIEQRGALGKTAHALGVSVDELKQLIRAVGIRPQTEEIRERFIREALAPGNVALRLELLTRTRYLDDLRIEKRFRDALSQELSTLIDAVRDAATSVPTLVDMLARQHALDAETLRRGLETLGLLEPWLGSPSSPKTPKE